MTTNANRYCPECKTKLEEEAPALGAEETTTTWEVCDACGYSRATIRRAS